MQRDNTLAESRCFSRAGASLRGSLDSSQPRSSNVNQLLQRSGGTSDTGMYFMS